MKNLNLLFNLLLFPFIFLIKIGKAISTKTTLLIFSTIFITTSIHAVELVNEQFTSNINGWSVSNSSKVYWVSDNSGSMFMDKGDWGEKTYNFGSSYADQTLDVEVRWCATSEWESNNDYLQVKVNGDTVEEDYDGGGCQTTTFTADADGDGDFKIRFRANSSSNNEDAYIDWFTVNGTPLNTGCDNSLDTSANDSYPGVAVPILNNTAVDASKCISGSSESDDEDHYWFKVNVAGTINIVTSSPNDNNYYLKVSSNTQGDLYSTTAGKDRSLSYPVSANEIIYLRTKETGSDTDWWQIDLEFIADPNAITCTNEYDVDNTECPGVTITSMDQITTDTRACITGLSTDGDGPDFYKFTVQEYGTLKIDGSSLNSGGSSWYLQIGSRCNAGDHYTSGSEESHDVPIFRVVPGDTIYVYAKESGDNEDNYQVDFEFIVNHDFKVYNDAYSTYKDTTISMPVLANDNPGSNGFDINTLTITGGPTPNHGNAVVDNGNIVYTPEGGWEGTVTLTYKIQDNNGVWSNEATVTIEVGTVFHNGDRDFTVRNPDSTRNIIGNYAIIGNANMCAYEGSNEKPWTGSCVESSSNDRPAHFLKVAADASNSDVINSSGSTLALPVDESTKVVWAGLYWQGVVHDSDIDDDFMDYKTINTGEEFGDTQIDFAAAGDTFGSEKVLFGLPGKEYFEIEADQLDYYKLGYGGFKDVTSILQDFEQVQGNVNGVYTVANIKAHQGTEDHHGNYASWSLVVIYENQDENFKNITLFDGFVTVDSSYKGALEMSGFLTPKVPPIKSKLAVFSMDGDGGATSISIKSQKDVITLIDDTNSLLDSSITSSITRNPNTTSLRTDLRIFDFEDALGPSETSATLIPRSGGDRYTASYFIMSADLREANICFDYTYGQDNYFITAPDIGNPRIVGDNFDPTKPLNVKFYFENNESEADVLISNIVLNIDPITNPLRYSSESTYVLPANSNKQHMSDVDDLNVSTSWLRNVPIGTLNNGDNAYVYYDLNITDNATSINSLINASISYSLTVTVGSDDITVDDVTTSIRNMDPCQKNAYYLPVYGIANVVHPSKVKSGDYFYYNLPTQVVGRTGNFKIQSMNETNIHEPNATTAIIALEMIDVAGFHYATATCTDPDATVISNKRVWTIINDNHLSNLVDKDDMNASGFFGSAVANAAFRISYNLTEDGDPLLLDELSSGYYKITNFPDYAANMQCQANFIPPNGNSSQVVTWCGNNGQGGGANGMDPAELEVCMECLYGIQTKKLCSRDNFSIRPESYSINLTDIDQTDSTVTRFIGNNTPSAANTPLASGYRYQIDVNATDHHNGMPTPRYNGSEIDAKFIWSPLATVNCDDEANKTISFHFYDGQATEEKKVSQVGRYALSILDENWTKVDHISEFMGHHTAPYFSGVDCQTNIGTVENASTWDVLNGCNTKSNHTNTVYPKTYTDMYITYHPYKFDLSTINLYTRPHSGNNWIYMNDLDKNKVMAVTMEGNVTARGADSIALSNYTDGCYANDLPINSVRTSNPSPVVDEDGNTVILEQALLQYDDTYTYPLQNADTNITLAEENFVPGDNNGSAVLKLYMNLKKPYDKTVNVADINFSALYAYGINDISNANALSDYQPEGNTTINQNISFFFSKVAPLPGTDGKQIFSPSTTATTVLLANTYCVDDIATGLNCSLVTQFSGIDEAFAGGGGWYRTGIHSSILGDGQVISMAPLAALPSLSISPDSNIGFDSNGSTATISISYPTTGRPVHPVIVITPDEWMKYNPDPSKNGLPEFILHFLNSGIRWKGVGHTGNVVETEPSGASNKRIGW